MIKIELNNREDDRYEIIVETNKSDPLEFFYVINRCFEAVAENTKTDIKQVEKFYKQAKKYIKE